MHVSFVCINKLFEKEPTVPRTARRSKHKQIRFYVVNIACVCRFANDYCTCNINVLVMLVKNVCCKLLFMQDVLSAGENRLGKNL